MSAYYNEIDAYAAQWLRNLIARNLIAPGDVDERSIVDVQPDDLRSYRQCHFFAGIGGWSLALRLAGWPDDRPVWTGSCPCQPFSAAGKQRGSDDERHLWPAFFRLILECRPAIVFGEQVAGGAGLAWWDHVAADLEDAGYAAAAANLGAHSVGAPHIRQRLYWMAEAGIARTGRDASAALGAETCGDSARRADGRGGDASIAGGADGRMADANGAGSLLGERDGESEQFRQRAPRGHDADGCGEVRGMGEASGAGLEVERGVRGAPRGQTGADAREATERASARNAWSNVEWLPCSDGKARPAQPGIFPLAHGLPGRVGRLRAYGNAIVPPLAAAFVTAAMP